MPIYCFHSIAHSHASCSHSFYPPRDLSMDHTTKLNPASFQSIALRNAPWISRHPVFAASLHHSFSIISANKSATASPYSLLPPLHSVLVSDNDMIARIQQHAIKVNYSETKTLHTDKSNTKHILQCDQSCFAKSRSFYFRRIRPIPLPVLSCSVHHHIISSIYNQPSL
jgi:hypothetical protein